MPVQLHDTSPPPPSGGVVCFGTDGGKEVLAVVFRVGRGRDVEDVRCLTVGNVGQAELVEGGIVEEVRGLTLVLLFLQTLDGSMNWLPSSKYVPVSKWKRTL